MTGGFLAQLGHFGVSDPGLASFGLLGFDTTDLPKATAVHFVSVLSTLVLWAPLHAPPTFRSMVAVVPSSGVVHASPAGQTRLCLPVPFAGTPAQEILDVVFSGIIPTPTIVRGDLCEIARVSGGPAPALSVGSKLPQNAPSTVFVGAAVGSVVFAGHVLARS